MAFQNPNTERKPDEKLYHSTLVKAGKPTAVTVMAKPKWVKGGTLCVVELKYNGIKHVYFTKNHDIAEKFDRWVGKPVMLMASGNEKMGTESMEIQECATPNFEQSTGQRVPTVTSSKSAPTWAAPAAAAPTEPKPTTHKDLEAKKYLCQAANLMRLCVKKANDIAVELGLPDAHRQGMATTFFIQSDRAGFINAMPINPYSPEELGMGASRAENLAKPERNESNDI